MLDAIDDAYEGGMRSPARSARSSLTVLERRAGPETTLAAFALPASLSALCVAGTGVLVMALVDFGPLSLLMAQHIAVMNIVAPLLAVPIARRMAIKTPVWVLAVAQVTLLWAWHTPAVQSASFDAPSLHVLLVTALAGFSILFWMSVLRLNAEASWSPLGALLITGKLACLLGALLIFAPRDLFGLPALSLGFCTVGPSSLADQQLAGLLMITACPVSYLVAGIVCACQRLSHLQRRSDRMALAAEA